MPTFYPLLSSMEPTVKSSTSVASYEYEATSLRAGQGRPGGVDLDIHEPLNQSTNPAAFRLLI